MFFNALDDQFSVGAGVHPVGSPAQVLGVEQIQKLDKRGQAAVGEGEIPVDAGVEPVVERRPFAVDRTGSRCSVRV